MGGDLLLMYYLLLKQEEGDVYVCDPKAGPHAVGPLLFSSITDAKKYADKKLMDRYKIRKFIKSKE